MKYWFTGLVLVLFLSARSQFNSEFLKYSDYHNHVSVYGDFEFNSTVLDNEFLSRFYLGGKIDDQLKDRVASRLQSSNYAGGEAVAGVNVFFGKDSSSFSWLVGAKHQEIMNASFSRDFYNTLFYGNSSYKGRYAFFDNTGINYMRFQEVKLGFVWKGVDSSGMIGGALSVLNGQSFYRLRTNDTNYLYTAPDATQLMFKADFDLAMSDTSGQKGFAMNGTGLSADFYVETPYRSKLGQSKFIITVNNLGFIRWNKKSLQYITDSVYTFNGVYVKDLKDVKDSTLNSYDQNQALNNSITSGYNYVNTNLPMNFILIHEVNFSRLFSLRTGIRHMFNANYRPFIFADTKFSFSTNFKVGGLLSYGGYGKVSGGLYTEISMKQKWFLKAGTNAIQGFISKTARGRDLF